ncbi:MAG: ATP-binding domain-containing protein, partial [Bacteroidales bacterium]|nr:ATP-binding domain-containing protein [Bacteroidales bacterium]
GEEIALRNKTLDIFVQQTSLLSETDRGDKNDDNTVSLMTIHSSKGLEFSYVFVAGMEENLFPSAMCIGSQVEMEEERRLFYVAMTRAKKELALSCAQMRFRNGSIAYNEESRFLADIDKDYFNENYNNLKEKTKLKTPSFSNSDFVSVNRNLKKIDTLPKPIGGTPVSDMNAFKEGMDVYHDKFGRGKILTLEGKGDDTKAEVEFNGFGIKKLVLRFAKLKLM